jgi:MoaA/NifB/PqqE/SkfB family radical SAM enzyme
MHEEVRRVPNAWPKVVDTINFCRNLLGPKKVKIAFTLNDTNFKQLRDAYDWSRKLGVDFTMAIAHSSDIYFAKAQENQNFKSDSVQWQFEYVIRKFLRSFRIKDWARAYFIDGLYKLSQGQKRPLKQFAGEDFFFLDPRGDVYPSVIDSTVMGNLFSYRNFSDLWFSPEAHKARAKIKGFEDDYWMVCTARTAMKRNPLKIANWIFKKKLKWGS